MAWPGRARRGWAWQAWHGKAWHGRRGVEWQGMAWYFFDYNNRSLFAFSFHLLKTG